LKTDGILPVNENLSTSLGKGGLANAFAI